MIAEQYINEGIRIRKAYLQNLKEILKEEPKIMSRKTSFEKLQTEMMSNTKTNGNPNFLSYVGCFIEVSTWT